MRSIIIIFTMILSQAVYALDLPEGWRMPTAQELADEPLRNESPTKYSTAEGDFNGDGKTDYAFLLKSTKFSGEGLWVKLSTANGDEWIVLEQTDWGKEYPNVNLAMGIDLADKGRYTTLCGKGYWTCEKGEPETLTLENPSIHYFKFASSDSVFFWNKKSKKFDRVWLSD
ncbi:hypothetical protein [Aeromonas sp. MdU4]|uniref:hypothetical protein n=1 Tax=Aeromonas sp. MdU4 TaxID=3342819 RepID=UPI0035BB0BE5